MNHEIKIELIDNKKTGSCIQIAKIKICGFADDSRTPIKRYIKVPLKDLSNLDVSLDKNCVSGS